MKQTESNETKPKSRFLTNPYIHHVHPLFQDLPYQRSKTSQMTQTTSLEDWPNSHLSINPCIHHEPPQSHPQPTWIRLLPPPPLQNPTQQKTSTPNSSLLLLQTSLPLTRQHTIKINPRPPPQVVPTSPTSPAQSLHPMSPLSLRPPYHHRPTSPPHLQTSRPLMLRSRLHPHPQRQPVKPSSRPTPQSLQISHPRTSHPQRPSLRHHNNVPNRLSLKRSMRRPIQCRQPRPVWRATNMCRQIRRAVPGDLWTRKR